MPELVFPSNAFITIENDAQEKVIVHDKIFKDSSEAATFLHSNVCVVVDDCAPDVDLSVDVTYINLP